MHQAGRSLLAGALGLLAAAPPPAGGVPPREGAAVISNVAIADEAGRLVVSYDLAASGPTPVRLVGEGREPLRIRSVAGDLGPAVAPGQRKKIVWSYGLDYAGGAPPGDVFLSVEVDRGRYFVLPLRGRFGVELDEDYLREGLRLAVAEGASDVVLEVDSPGGSLPEAVDMLELLSEWREAHAAVSPVVLVRRGEHAAAFFAACAGPLYLAPGGTVSGGEASRPGGAEVPVEEHSFTNDVGRKLRSFAERRGLEWPLLEALLVPRRLAVVLGPRSKPEAPRVVVLRQWEAVPPMHTLLCDGERTVRLDAANAQIAGLAEGVAKDYLDLGRQVGHPGWASAGDRGRRLSEDFGKEVEETLAQYGGLLETLRETLVFLESPEAAKNYLPQDASDFREALADLDALAEDYPFVRARLTAELPMGVAELRQRGEALLAKLKSVEVKTAGAPRARRPPRARAASGPSPSNAGSSSGGRG